MESKYVVLSFCRLKSLYRYIKKLDLKMCTQKCHILLTINNFSGHLLDYIPTNIQIEFFKPNLTAFVQPLDVGIVAVISPRYELEKYRS